MASIVRTRIVADQVAEKRFTLLNQKDNSQTEEREAIGFRKLRREGLKRLAR